MLKSNQVVDNFLRSGKQKDVRSKDDNYMNEYAEMYSTVQTAKAQLAASKNGLKAPANGTSGTGLIYHKKAGQQFGVQQSETDDLNALQYYQNRQSYPNNNRPMYGNHLIAGTNKPMLNARSTDMIRELGDQKRNHYESSGDERKTFLNPHNLKLNSEERQESQSEYEVDDNSSGGGPKHRLTAEVQRRAPLTLD